MEKNNSSKFIGIIALFIVVVVGGLFLTKNIGHLYTISIVLTILSIDDCLICLTAGYLLEIQRKSLIEPCTITQ